MSTHPRPAINAAAALETEVRIVEQTRLLRNGLGQTDRYSDLRGDEHPLAAMSAAEALLVLALLERHATTLHRGELAEHLLRAATHGGRERDAPIEAHRRIASTSAAEWLRATPLHRALIERAGHEKPRSEGESHDRTEQKRAS